MKEILLSWLRESMNFVIDSNNISQALKDGMIFVRILKYYNAINVYSIKNVFPSEDDDTCRNNLKQLKIWFKLLAIDFTDDIINEIVCGNTSLCISILYQLFVAFETNTSLHLATKQKERHVIKQCDKQFKVSQSGLQHIEDEQTGGSRSGYKFGDPFLKYKDMIHWYEKKHNKKEKCICCKNEPERSSILDDKIQKNIYIKRKTDSKLKPMSRKCCEDDVHYVRHELSRPSKFNFVSGSSDCLSNHIIKEESSRKEGKYINFDCISNFLSIDNSIQSNFLPPISLKRHYESELPPKAQKYMKDLKSNTGFLCKNHTEKSCDTTIMNKLWNLILDNESTDLKNLFACRLLKQSSYEKDMSAKFVSIMSQNVIQKRCFAELQSRIDIWESASKESLSKIYNDDGVFKDINSENTGDCESDDNVQSSYLNDDKLRYIHSDYYQYYLNEEKRTVELHRKLYAEKLKLRFDRHYATCLNALLDLVDLAIRRSEYKKKYNFEVPEGAWDDWKCLFHHEQPIFSYLGSSESLELPEDPYSIHFREEMIRQDVIIEHHLDMYLDVDGMWNVFTNDLNEDDINSSPKIQFYTINHESQILLGYVVHRVLEFKYPGPPQQKPADIPKYPIAAVINGIDDVKAVKHLKKIFMEVDVLVVDVNSAVNFCLQAYNDKLNDGEYNISSSEVGNEIHSYLAEDGNEFEEELVESRIKEDFTQTTSSLFEIRDDTRLEDVIKIGYNLFEAILLGNAIPVSFLVNAVIQYIKEHDQKIKGWVLVNFPSTLYQASLIENTLSGKKFPYPLEDDTLSTSGSECWITVSKDLFTMDSSTSFEIEVRSSRIVPNPKIYDGNDKFKTYFTMFISTVEGKTFILDNFNSTSTSDSGQSESTLLLEQPEKEGVPTLHHFYETQGIIYDFIYENFDTSTLKHLVRVILLNYFNDPKGAGPKDLYEDNFFKEIEPSVLLNNWLDPPTSDNISLYKLLKPNNFRDEYVEQEANSIIKSNDSVVMKKANEWAYTNLPILDSAVIALATFWEALETVYINDLKSVFLLQCNTGFSIIYYMSFINKQIDLYLNREDERQKIVSEFLEAYNGIPQVLRSDNEMKSELHLRVIELKEQLTELCVKNRDDTEELLRTIINQNWTYQEMAFYTNFYIKLIQIEAQRCIHTLEFLNDYYLAMLGNYNSQPLPTITVSDIDIYMGEEVFEEEYLDDNSESVYDFALHLEPIIEMKRIPEEVNDLLYASIINDNLQYNSDGFKPLSCNILEEKVMKCHKGVLEVKSQIDGVIASEKLAALRNVKDETSNKKTEKSTGKRKTNRGQSTNETREESETKQSDKEKKELSMKHLFEEWTTAAKNEIDRFTFRIKQIKQRGNKDFYEILRISGDTFSKIKNRVHEKYSNEITCINNICKLFQYAIEEKTPIAADLFFRHDKFYTIQHPIEEVVESIQLPAALDEMLFEESFTVKQLEVLLNRLSHIAPNGRISRGAFIKFIQSIIWHTYSQENIKLVPNIWKQLEPYELDTLFQKVFGNRSVVMWRDFLVFCLDLPFPLTEDIIDARLQFLRYDLKETETVSYDDYMQTTLWFHRELPENPLHALRNILAKQFIFSLFRSESYELNYMSFLSSFCKDLDPKVGFGKGLSLFLGRCVIVYREDLYLENIMTDHIDTKFKIANDILNEILTDITCNSMADYRDSIFEIRDAFSVVDQSIYASSADSDSDIEAIFTDSMYNQFFRRHQILQWTSKVPNTLIIATLCVAYSSSYLPGHRFMTSDVLKAVQQYFSTSSEDDVFVPDFLELWWMECLLEDSLRFKSSSLANIIKTIIRERNQ